MNDSTYATSALELGCQHCASSKFAPSLLVNIFTSPGLYAQSIFKPKAVRREFNTPVHVTVCAFPCPPPEHLIYGYMFWQDQHKMESAIAPISRTSAQSLLCCESRGPNKISCRVSATRAGSVERHILFETSASHKENRTKNKQKSHGLAFHSDTYSSISIFLHDSRQRRKRHASEERS